MTPLVPACLGAIAIASCAAAWRSARRARVAFAVCSLAAVVTTGAASANAYFAYYPTAGSLLGTVARDQVATGYLAARPTAAIPPPAPGPTAPAGRTRGVVEQVVIPGAASGFHARRAWVYLPPAWFDTPRPRLGVLLLLHGTPGTPGDWARGGAADVTADNWARGHGGRAPIIVMPDINGSAFGDTECLNGPAGNADTYLTVDVPSWVGANLDPGPGRWVIGGLSEGGYCAMQLAARHPLVFGAFADFGGLDRATFSYGANAPPAPTIAHAVAPSLFARPVRPSIGGWFEAGGADRGTTRSELTAAALARKDGVTTMTIVRPGARHTFRLWRQALVDAFPWIMGRLGEAPASGPGVVTGRVPTTPIAGAV